MWLGKSVGAVFVVLSKDPALEVLPSNDAKIPVTLMAFDMI